MLMVGLLADSKVEKMDELTVFVTVASTENHSVDVMGRQKAYLRAGPMG